MSTKNEKPNAESNGTKPPRSESETKPAVQDVGPPDERVDDETSVDDGKTTRRQE